MNRTQLRYAIIGVIAETTNVHNGCIARWNIYTRLWGKTQREQFQQSLLLSLASLVEDGLITEAPDMPERYQLILK